MDGSVVFKLMHKINNLKQGDLSVPEYYHKLNSLWREFDILTILPACVCEGRTAYTYDAKSGQAKHTQLIRLMQFLMGLNDVYQPIRSTILAKDPLPNVKDAFYVVSMEESHKGSSSWWSTILAKDPLPNVKDAFYVVSMEESHKGLHPGGYDANKSQPTTFVAKTNNNTNNFNRRVNTNNNNKNDMFNVVDISSLMLTVGHLNGTLAKITAISSLRLTIGIVLFDVLVISEYNVRLLSVNKMIKDNKFFVGLDEHKCYSGFESGQNYGD
nr:ribonuclease H-like domain-containing protein [Tanacetum cinerariifolium]